MKEKITKIYDNQFDPDYIRDKLTDTEDTVRRNIIRVDRQCKGVAGISKKMLDTIFITKMMAVHIYLTGSLILKLIFMFNINSFYHADALKLHY